MFSMVTHRPHHVHAPSPSCPPTPPPVIPEIPTGTPSDCVGCEPTTPPPSTPDIPVAHPSDCVGCDTPPPPPTPEIPGGHPPDCAGCEPPPPPPITPEIPVGNPSDCIGCDTTHPIAPMPTAAAADGITIDANGTITLGTNTVIEGEQIIIENGTITVIDDLGNTVVTGNTFGIDHSNEGVGSININGTPPSTPTDVLGSLPATGTTIITNPNGNVGTTLNTTVEITLTETTSIDADNFTFGTVSTDSLVQDEAIAVVYLPTGHGASAATAFTETSSALIALVGNVDAHDSLIAA